MTAPAQETLRRGWCPSTLRPMESGDGWLVRLHPPGGRLTPSQLQRVAALAREAGSGLVEVSSRGNLQLRGVRAETHPALVAGLTAELLVDEAGGSGPQRLVLASPLAGEAPSDLIDAAALARAVEAAGRAVSGLSPKTSVIADGGGEIALDALGADLRLVATSAAALRIGLSHGLWLGPVAPETTPAAVARLLAAFAAWRAREPATLHRLRDLPQEGLTALGAECGLSPCPPPAARPAPRRAGLFPLKGGRAALVAGLPFGRCDADLLTRLAKAAAASGASEIRFSPWRGLAFVGLDPDAAEALARTCRTFGLIIDDADPRLSVRACAGKPACLRGETAAMADAAVLAKAAAPLLSAGLTLHLSACVKSCAHAGAADLTLVGHEGRYDVVLDGTTRDKPIARLDLSQIVQRLQPGQEFFARLTGRGAMGQKV